MDPITALVLAGSAAHVAKEAVTDAVQRIFGPTFDVIGERIKNRIFGPNVGKIIGDAVTLVIASGQIPQPVPGRILMPLLEGAAWEDDENLQAKWSALLANAAVMDNNGLILPSFVDTMRHLVPVQAQILDWMYSRREPSDLTGYRYPPIHHDKVGAKFTLARRASTLLITDLERMSLIRPLDRLGRLGDEDATPQMRADSIYNEIEFTAFGLAFIEACTPPARPAQH